jgi:ribosome maturation factor RimP
VTPERGRDAILEEILRLAAEVGRSFGLEVVEATYHPAGRGGALRVTIDSPGPPGVTIEDCQRFSAAFDRLLDEHEVIDGSYVLEVSSPGLDRPIRTDDDIRRNTGRRIEVETSQPVGGSRSFRGILLGADGDALRLRDDEGMEVSLPRPVVAKVRQEMDIRPKEKPGRRAGKRRQRDIV